MKKIQERQKNRFIRGLIYLAGIIAYHFTLYRPLIFLQAQLNFILPLLIGLAGLAIGYAAAVPKQGTEKDECLHAGASLSFATILLLPSMLMNYRYRLGTPGDEIFRFSQDVFAAFISGVAFYFVFQMGVVGAIRLATNLWGRYEKLPLPF